MSETVKKLRQVCKCENCGNEAEMVITCTLPEKDAAAPQAAAHPPEKQRLKGTGTCSSCGNEADLWVDL